MATKKSFSKEQWEAMTGTEMSQLLPDGENVESTEESFTGNVAIETPLTVTEQSEIQSGNLQMPLSCKSRKSKTANQYLSVARCATDLTSLSANSEAAEWVFRDFLKTSPDNILKSTRKSLSSGVNYNICPMKKCICTLHYCRQASLNSSNRSEEWNVCFGEGARLSFGMPKKCRTSRHCTRKTSPHFHKWR